LGLLTCKNRLPYNLYCVGGDVKHCTIQYNPILLTAHTLSDVLFHRYTNHCPGDAALASGRLGTMLMLVAVSLGLMLLHISMVVKCNHQILNCHVSFVPVCLTASGCLFNDNSVVTVSFAFLCYNIANRVGSFTRLGDLIFSGFR